MTKRPICSPRGGLHGAALCPLKAALSAGCGLKACTADGAGRGKKGEPEPYSAEGTFSGLIAMYFPLSVPPFSSPQAPTPSNRAERYAIPFRVRPHPAQLGRVAVHGGQPHHQRVQHGGAGGHGRVHPVRHVQRLGVRRMIRDIDKKEKRTTAKREEIFYREMDLRKKRLIIYRG